MRLSGIPVYETLQAYQIFKRLDKGSSEIMVTRSKYVYKDNWRSPKEVDKLVRSFVRSPSLNICCGHQPIGDLRADIEITTKPDILCDAFNLPFKHGSFASVVCDPPWNLGYPQRIKLTKELANVIDAGGYLIFNAPWIPTCKGMTIKEIYVLHHHYCHQNVTLLTISQKVNQLLF